MTLHSARFLPGAGRILAIFTCASLAGCTATEHDAPSAARDAKVVVTPVKPLRKHLVRTIDLPGRVVASESTPVHAKITGYVQSIAVDIGDRVAGPAGDQPGAILCELHAPELDEELAEKKAMVEQAKALVIQAEAGVKVAEAAAHSAAARQREAQASIAKEDSLLARWRSEHDRLVKLTAEGVVTTKVAEEAKAEMDAAAAAREEALAKVESAQALQQEAEAGHAKAQADLVAVQSQLAVAQAEQRRLESMVEYTKIRAPFDGVVVERCVHTGHLVQAGAASGGHLFSVMRIDPIRLTLDVPEAEAIHVERGSIVRFRPPGSQSAPIAAAISRTSWSLKDASRTLQVEVDIPNPVGRWRPGAYLQVALEVADIPDALCIPKTAFFIQEKIPYCYVISPEGTLQRRQIELGVQSGDEWEVRSGLSEAENLIGRNVAAFREGQQVEIAPPAPAPQS